MFYLMVCEHSVRFGEEDDFEFPSINVSNPLHSAQAPQFTTRVRKNEIGAGGEVVAPSPPCRTRSGHINHPPSAESACFGHDGAALWALRSTHWRELVPAQRGSWAWHRLLGWSGVGFACFRYGNLSQSFPPPPYLPNERKLLNPDPGRCPGSPAPEKSGSGKALLPSRVLQQFLALLLASGKWRRFSWKTFLTGTDRNLERWLVSLFA